MLPVGIIIHLTIHLTGLTGVGIGDDFSEEGRSVKARVAVPRQNVLVHGIDFS